LNNKVIIEAFIGTIGKRTFCPAIRRSYAMFLFNRSGLAVCVALVVAGLPVLLQFAF
jgi:hypothetical protein